MRSGYNCIYVLRTFHVTEEVPAHQLLGLQAARLVFILLLSI